MDIEPLSDKRVSYFFDEEIAMYTFKKGHPMRPLRMKITDEILRVYNVHPLLRRFDSTVTNMPDEVFYNFHSEEYIDLLKNISEETLPIYQDQFARFGFSADCPHPINSKFYDFCKLYTTGSVFQASLLNERVVDLSINWSGGLHHAKRQEASGFCYVNDCVLAIIELLKVHDRVLYLDIDVHHGDGVEEAFLTTNRVLTCSLHKFKDFFPGTGNYDDIGFEKGKYHSVNFPLSEGIDDITYEHIFVPIVEAIFENFKPQAVVLQCGSDSISGDKLGCFNLSIKGHGFAVQHIKSKGLPVLMLGGGGYTLRNVPRCWAYETSVALGVELDNEIPDNEYINYFHPEKKLHTPLSNMENMNKPDELHFIKCNLLDNLRRLELYTPELNVESKYGPDPKAKAIAEKLQSNFEADEEKSEKKRSNINY